MPAMSPACAPRSPSGRTVRSSRLRYPRVYAAGETTPDALLSDEARWTSTYRYLKEEPRPDSAAFRHGVYAAAIAGPVVSPTSYVGFIIP